MARPSKYNDETVTKALAYLEGCYDELPTVEGLAVRLGVHKDTVYEWATHEDKREFSDTLNKIKMIQADQLLQKALKGEYNATIAKLMLSVNHGYKESTQVDNVSSDGSMTPSDRVVFEIVDPYED